MLRIVAQQLAVLGQVLTHAVGINQHGAAATSEFGDRLARERRLAGAGLTAEQNRARGGLLAARVQRFALDARVRPLEDEIGDGVHDAPDQPRFAFSCCACGP